MKTSRVTLLFVFLLWHKLTAQCPNDITFSTQEQINSFPTDFPGCTAIPGNVTVNGNGINNLNGLSDLNSIGGILNISSNGALTNLIGLDNLKSIGSSLTISFNDALTSLTGLDSLKSIGGNLEIGWHNTLTNLSGLENLTSIDGSLIFVVNDSLNSLAGLGNLTFIGGGLNFHNNYSLTSLAGLENLASIGGNLVIGGTFLIDPSGNPNLASLTGLENLTSIGDDLVIKYNDALTSLSGLDNLISIGGGLYIQNNIALSACAVESICAYLTSPAGAIVIDSNATGCASYSEVATACLGYTNTISGKVFWDEGDCQYDGAELPLRHWLVKAESDSLTFYAVTDTMGNYFMVADTGTYVLSITAPNQLWDPCFDTIELVFTQLNQTIDTNIAVLDMLSCPLLNVDIGTALLRRCYNNYYRVNYCNEGTAAAENAYVELYFDTFLDVDTSSLPDPWGPLGGNGFRVDLGDVQAGDCGAFSVKVNVNCDSTEAGEIKYVEAHIFPDTLCFIPLGWDGSNIVVKATCSGDTVFFTVKNAGSGDMEQPAGFIIVEGTVLHPGGELQLQAGQDTVVLVLNAADQTWRLEVAQHPEHPFSQIAAAFSYKCFDLDLPAVFLQFPQDEASPFVAVDCRQIVSSFDPNDKSASPLGLGDEHAIRDNTPLEYHIRFQNTGTDTAITVVVRDTLSPFLDPATVRPGAASHPYRFDMSGNGILKFTFDNIMLPDSNVNEEASHGFVQFAVAQKSSPVYPPGTVIKNHAAIYFDYNAPVLTDTVFHTVASPVTAVYRDTVCGSSNADTLLADTIQFSYFEVIRETFVSDTLYTLLHAVGNKGDSLFGFLLQTDTTFILKYISANGCDSIVSVDITVPAKEPQEALPFQLFPNPTRGDLTLRFTLGKEEKIAAVEVFDARGRLKRVFLPPDGWNGKDAMTLPAWGLPGGVYFITVYGQKETWAGRFVKFD